MMRPMMQTAAPTKPVKKLVPQEIQKVCVTVFKI